MGCMGVTDTLELGWALQARLAAISLSHTEYDGHSNSRHSTWPATSMW